MRAFWQAEVNYRKKIGQNSTPQNATVSSLLTYLKSSPWDALFSAMSQYKIENHRHKTEVRLNLKSANKVTRELKQHPEAIAPQERMNAWFLRSTMPSVTLPSPQHKKTVPSKTSKSNLGVSRFFKPIFETHL